MLACTETVTFVRPVRGIDDDSYALTAVSGVSWFGKTRVTAEGAGVVFDSVLYLRIPAAALPTGFLPAVGDYVLRGEPAGEITGPGALAALGAREVLAVGDNRRGRLRPHVLVIAK